MDNFEFFKEFAIRNSRDIKYKTKTNIEMKKIVVDREYIEVSTMFDDASINELYCGPIRRCELYAKTYQFIRDNQKLFIEAE